MPDNAIATSDMVLEVVMMDMIGIGVPLDSSSSGCTLPKLKYVYVANAPVIPAKKKEGARKHMASTCS